MLTEYFPVLVFLAVATGLSLVLMAVPMVVNRRQVGKVKESQYECGFDAFSGARAQFDIQFYLVAILFIVFDLEVAFLFPWAMSFGTIGMVGFWSMMIFLGLLTVGFIYEWKKGALEWN